MLNAYRRDTGDPGRPASPSSSFPRRPTMGGASSRTRSRSCATTIPTMFRLPTARPVPPASGRSRSRSGSSRTSRSRRWHTSPASGSRPNGSSSSSRRSSTRASTTSWPCVATRPRGETEWVPHPGRASLVGRVDRADQVTLPGLCIGAACFPETHPEATAPDQDLKYAKSKVDAGASFLITQLFFDNEDYFDSSSGRVRSGSTCRSSPDHADHELRADQALHQHVRRFHPRGAARAARSPRFRSSRPRRLMRRARNPSLTGRREIRSDVTRE